MNKKEQELSNDIGKWYVKEIDKKIHWNIIKTILMMLLMIFLTCCAIGIMYFVRELRL